MSTYDLKRQSPKPMSDGICLNIGCGLNAGDSWLNIDASPTLGLSRVPLVGHFLRSKKAIPDWPPNVRQGDIVRGLRIPSRSCELVFASHVVEHWTLPDFERALSNIRSYMHEGAVFRLITPDLQQLTTDYVRLKSSTENPQSTIAAELFMKESGLGSKSSRLGLMNRFRDALSNSRHQWLWDSESMTAKLTEMGFKKVELRDYGNWADSRFAEVEIAGRHEKSFCLECRK